MKRKVFCVCDVEIGYVSALSHFIQKREGQRFEVRGFTKKESLLEYLKDGQIDVALVTEAFMENIGFPLEDVFSGDSTFLLSDQNGSRQSGFRMIDRYQDVDSILNEVLAEMFYEEKTTESNSDKKPKVFGIYSPIGRCGKSLMSLSLAGALAESGQTLCVSLDGISGIEEFSPEKAKRNVSDILFMLSQWPGLRNEVVEEINENVLPSGAVALGAPSYPEDIRQAEEGSIERMISELCKLKCYRYIVVDIGLDAPVSDKLLNLCDQIVMPVPEDEISQIKARNWEKAQNNNCLDKVKIIGAIPKREMDNWAKQFAVRNCD